MRYEDMIFYSPDGCWYWTGATINRTGTHPTPKVTIKGKVHVAYRVIYELLRGKIPHGMCACHHCDNRLCVNPDHIFIGTMKDNMDDMRKKGRENFVRGGNHPNTKFTDSEVIEIINMKKTMTVREIAKLKEAPFGTIDCIIYRKNTWKHIR